MERQEYPAMLATLQPNQAIDVLNDRVRQVGSLNAHIADWLQERRRLEEQYSSGLRKLARRMPPGDATELGVFSVSWTSLTNSLETLADSHHTFATKIEADVERPLRDFTHSNREMQSMSTIQGNLASLAKDIDNALKKNERLASKGGKAKSVNVANASSDLDNAQSQWDNQAPYVFEQLQALDETRVNQLRDVLTQFQTHEVDRVERDRLLAEQCLNVILNIETKDEIQTFALRSAQGGPAPSRPTTMQTQRSSRQSVLFSSAPSLAAQPSGSHLADDATSQRSGSIPAEPEKKGGLKGLKRGLGTVLGRRRESKIILPTRNGSESPERQAKGNSGFNSFSSRFGRGRDLPTPLEDEETSRPRSPLRTITSSSTQPTSPVPAEREPAHIDGSAQSLIAAGLMPNGHDTNHSHAADVAQLQEPLQPSAPVSSVPVSREAEPAAPRDNYGFSVPPPQLDPISQAEAEAADGSQPAFNVNIRQAPISEEGSDAALASMANTLKMQAPPTQRRAGTVRGRRDMRASVYAPSPVMTPEPVIEESVASSPDLAPPAIMTRELQPTASPPPGVDSAFAPPPTIQTQTQPQLSLYPTQSTGGLPSVPQSPASPTLSSPVSRGGTDNAFSPFHGSAAAVAASVFNRPTSSMGPVGSFDHNDSQSIRSGRSLSSSTSQGASKHPTDITAPGLNASVIETVSAWFEHGLCTRSVVIGEVGLVHNGSLNTNFPEMIRLENFDKLEKVAPNPAFISDAASGSKGEYSVDLRHLSKLGVAFKYQLATSSGELAPLLLSTAWKIEKGTAMCILSYSLNPSFALPSGTSSVEAKNLTLILHLGSEGAKALSCMSKPVGTFDRHRNLIYWNLGDVSLSSTPSKLLAKFGTGEGEAKQGHVEAKWELLGSQGSGLEVSVKDGGSRKTEEDPFADEEEKERGSLESAGGWKPVQGKRKLIAGTYSAQ